MAFARSNLFAQRAVLLLMVCSQTSQAFNCGQLVRRVGGVTGQWIAGVYHRTFPTAPPEFKMPFEAARAELTKQGYRTVAEVRSEVIIEDVSHLPIPIIRVRRETELRQSEHVRDEINQLSLLQERAEINAAGGGFKGLGVAKGIKRKHESFRQWWNANHARLTSQNALDEVSHRSMNDLFHEAFMEYLTAAPARLGERVRIPPHLRRPLEIVSVTVQKPIKWTFRLLVYSTFLSIAPSLGSKVTAPIMAEVDRRTSGYAANYQVQLTKLLNSVNKSDAMAHSGSTGNKLLDVLKKSSNMKPEQVAAALDDYNNVFAQSRVLTPAALRGDQNEGRGIYTWIGINFPSETMQRLSMYDGIVQNDKNFLLQQKVALDSLKRANPVAFNAKSIDELSNDSDKGLFQLKSDLEKRSSEVSVHIDQTKRRIAASLISWQVMEFMHGELFYSDGANSIGKVYRDTLTKNGMIEYLKEYEGEFSEAMKSLNYAFDTGKVQLALFKHMPPEMQKNLVLADAQLRESGQADKSTFEGDRRKYYDSALRSDEFSLEETEAMKR